MQKIADTANRYLELDYHGGTEVLHYLTMLRDRVGFDNLKAKVVNPLKGRKIGAYYGCLLLRPPRQCILTTPKTPPLWRILSVLWARSRLSSNAQRVLRRICFHEG